VRRIREKENERDVAEIELSNLNLSHIDAREKDLVRSVFHLYSKGSKILFSSALLSYFIGIHDAFTF
jgi:hypothetical protein